MAALTPDGMTFKEVFLENTHLADAQKQVKKYILIRTPAEINKLRRFHCPRITYEKRHCPGEFKAKLCADDVALGRYKFVPVKYPTEQERKRILRKRQRLQKRSLIKTPKIVLNESTGKDEIEDDKENNEDEKTESDMNSEDGPPEGMPQITSDDVKGIKAMRKWKKKTFTVESESSDDDDDDDSSHVSGEYKEYLDKLNRERVLRTPDFDTDLESTDESDIEQYIDAKGKKRRRKISQTAKNYYWSCSRYHLTPIKAFVRQCGKATVNIRHRMLNHKDARPIAITLVNDRKTSFLDVSFNPLGPIGTSSIAQMLSQNNYIVELNLSSTFPEREGLQALLEGLRHNHILHRLYLDDNELIPSDGEVLGQMILDLPGLTELHVANNRLGGEGTKRIGRALATSKGKLNVLNLRYNHIRTDAAAQLAMSLVKNKTLRSLDLSWNGFGLEGCKALASALEKNSTLKDLDISWNRIGIKCLDLLIDGLIKNKGLLCIKVASNPLTTEGLKALLIAITDTKTNTLTELDLRGVPVDEEFFELKSQLIDSRTIRIHHEQNIHLGTTDLTREGDGTFLDNYDPALVMFEFMKKDNLRVIDFFQFFDVRKRDKLSKSDLAAGFNVLMIPFTQHQIDMIMKKLDGDKDGFISLDEMVKGYTKCDKQVKLRRIKASKKKIKDEGLENLWIYLKSLIVKRKEENALKTAINSVMRRSSLLPGADNKRGSIFAGVAGVDGDRKGSLFAGSPTTGRRSSLFPTSGDGGRRGSIIPEASLLLGATDGRRGSGDSRRGSLLLATTGRRGSGDVRRDSLLLAAAAAGLLDPDGNMSRRGSLLPNKDSPRGSLFPGGREGRRGSFRFLPEVDQRVKSPASYSRRGSDNNSLVDGNTDSYERRGSFGLTQSNRPDMILEAEDSSLHVDN